MKLMPSACSFCSAFHCLRASWSRSRSASTHLPRNSTRPSVAAVEGQVGVEIEHLIHADHADRFAADVDLDLRPGRFFRGPPIGQPHDDAGLFDTWRFGEEAIRFADRPGLRREQRFRIEQLANQPRPLSRAPHRLEQRHEFGLLPGAGVSPQRFGERKMLRPGLARQPMGEGRQEREGPLGIALVLGEMKGDAADEVPERVDRAEPRRRALGMLVAAGDDQVAQLAPQPGERRRRQVLQAAHRRGLGDQSLQVVDAGLAQRFPRSPFLEVAQALEEPAREAAPIHQGRGQLRAKVRREEQQALGAGFSERLAQRLRDRFGERRVRVGAVLDAQVAAGGDHQIKC
jgi:hypothetical protein